jgi:DNA-binding NtrC family response regulator
MKKCILIFDDDQEILSVCKIILEQKNYMAETRICCDNIINGFVDTRNRWGECNKPYEE